MGKTSHVFILFCRSTEQLPESESVPFCKIVLDAVGVAPQPAHPVRRAHCEYSNDSYQGTSRIPHDSTRSQIISSCSVVRLELDRCNATGRHEAPVVSSKTYDSTSLYTDSPQYNLKVRLETTSSWYTDVGYKPRGRAVCQRGRTAFMKRKEYA